MGTCRGEEVWMAAAPREFLDEVYDDIQTKSKGNLCMKPREYHIWAMFMAYCLHRCSIADVYITETKYPAKIGDIGEVRKNSSRAGYVQWNGARAQPIHLRARRSTWHA